MYLAMRVNTLQYIKFNHYTPGTKENLAPPVAKELIEANSLGQVFVLYHALTDVQFDPHGSQNVHGGVPTGTG